MGDAIRIGEPAIEIRLRRNRRARRLVLRVAQGGAATLTLPPGVTLAHARTFLRDQEAWLRQRLDAAGARGRLVADGCALPFFGRTLTVRAATGPVGLVGDVLTVGAAGQRTGPRVAAWLREEARRACVLGVEGHAARLGRRPGRISLRDPRTRWGSCTATGDLMFSWRLAMAPPEVLDYVVAHEVAHLAELNHSPQFWAVVRRLCPAMEGPRDWLRRNGAGLHAYDFGLARA